MIEVDHLYKTYPGPTHALRGANLKISQGEFIFLLGASGAGKTTLFRIISAFDRPTSGRVKVAGQDVIHLRQDQIPHFRRRIGVVFQDFKLLPQWSIEQNVALPLKIKGESGAAVDFKVAQILDEVGLTSRRKDPAHCLSGGEQQRVAIARAIIHQPGVLIADEPTGNLDPKLTLEITELFERVCSRGTTVFIATHNWDLVKRKNKRSLTLDQGAIREVSCSEL